MIQYWDNLYPPFEKLRIVNKVTYRTKLSPISDLMNICVIVKRIKIIFYTIIKPFSTNVPLIKRICYTIIKAFSTNVPLMDKPGSWFLLAKCSKNTCGRETF